jgi:hypothetical protein
MTDGPTMNILTILPLAFVMVAGPQILSAIFLATSEDWRRNSAAFLAGAALSISLFVGIAYVVGRGINSAGGDNTLDILVLVLLVAAGINVFRTRKTAEPPKWMGKLQTATPKVSFGLGFLLLGVFPTSSPPGPSARTCRTTAIPGGISCPSLPSRCCSLPFRRCSSFCSGSGRERSCRRCGTG